jgi:hypothetical protein
MSKVLQDANRVVLSWPESSPDLNPTVHLLSVAKNKIKKTTIITKAGLIEKLTQIWLCDVDIKEQSS